MRKQVCLSVAGVLVLVGAIILGAVVTYDPLLLLYSDRALTFEGALQIAERLDRIADDLEMPPVPDSNAGLVALAVEIVPFFYYDNIVEGDGRLPTITWNLFLGERNFHVLGTTYIGSDWIELNIRYINRYSAWYHRDSVVATLTHELGHSQGLYAYGDEDTEPATQLATIEVLAAMGRARNVWAFPAFVREVQGYAEDFAFSQALKQNRMDEYRAYIRRAGNSGTFSEASFDRAMNHWASNMQTLKLILSRYGERPYRLLVEAINRPSHLTEQMLPIPNDWHRIEMNDTAWALQHLYDLARDYPDLLAEFMQRSSEE